MLDSVAMKYKCEYENCNKTFSRPYRLAQHYNSHIGIKLHRCTEQGCEKTYSNSSHLKRHVNLSHKRNTLKHVYSCTHPECESTFETSWGLRRHVKKHASTVTCPAKPSEYCRTCGQTYRGQSEAKIREHERKHSVQRCEECNKFFLSMAALQKHLVTHCDFFECGHCGVKCKTKGSLRDHVVALHSEFCSIFVCGKENCSKVFFYKRNLNKHHRTCHSSGVYKCSVSSCEKILKHKHSFQRHLQLHKENKIRVKKTMKKDFCADVTVSLCAT